MTQQTLQDRYREFKRNTGTTDKAVAQTIGYTPGVISSWLKEKYTGANAEVEKAISEYLAIQADSSAFGGIDIPFVPTYNAKMISAVIKRAQVDKNMALIIGDSGTGKTYGVKNWCTRYPRTSVHVHVDVTFNPKILISELHKTLGMGGHGSKYTMLKDCVECLHNTDRVILIDEADLLSITSIELLRALHDKSGVGLVMLGLPVLAETVRGSRGELARVNTRIVNYRKLEHITIEDASAIIATMIPDSDAFVKTFYTLAKSNGRILGNLMKNVVRVHRESNHEITTSLIEKCYEMLYR